MKGPSTLLVSTLYRRPACTAFHLPATRTRPRSIFCACVCLAMRLLKLHLVAAETFFVFFFIPLPKLAADPSGLFRYSIRRIAWCWFISFSFLCALSVRSAAEASEHPARTKCNQNVSSLSSDACLHFFSPIFELFFLCDVVLPSRLAFYSSRMISYTMTVAPEMLYTREE